MISIKTKDLSEDTLKQIAIATIGDSDKLQVGEQVVAIGNALGYGQSVTTGIVSATNRSVSTVQIQTNHNRIFKPMQLLTQVTQVEHY